MPVTESSTVLKAKSLFPAEYGTHFTDMQNRNHDNTRLRTCLDKLFYKHFQKKMLIILTYV